MKLILVSDTHTLHSQVILPEGDILIHAGDLTRSGNLKELASAIEWLKSAPYEHVICVGGNHDFALEAFMKEGQEQLLRTNIFERVTYLRDSEICIGGKKFYGSPWCPAYQDWAFNCPRGPEMKKKWAQIPDDTDVLITHTPPHGVLDHYFHSRLGCEDLTERVKQVRPQVHVFGHIHGGYGNVIRDGTWFFNACTTTIREKNNEFYYKNANEPWTIEI